MEEVQGFSPDLEDVFSFSLLAKRSNLFPMGEITEIALRSMMEATCPPGLIGNRFGVPAPRG
jgi:hypothetical protein